MYDPTRFSRCTIPGQTEGLHHYIATSRPSGTHRWSEFSVVGVTVYGDDCIMNQREFRHVYGCQAVLFQPYQTKSALSGTKWGHTQLLLLDGVRVYVGHERMDNARSTNYRSEAGVILKPHTGQQLTPTALETDSNSLFMGSSHPI